MRRRPPGWLVVAVVLAAPFVVLAVRVVVGIDPSPGGDVALIELRTRDVGTAHSPTLGSYGRYGFNHPGPLWFYALALPYRVTGQLELGVLFVGVLSMAAILWVAARHGGLRWAALLTAVLVWGAGPAFVADPWEPHGLLLPAAALLLLTFDTAAGRAWSLPLVAGVASLLGAAQATLLPYALAMGALALWSARRQLRPVLVAAGVVLVLCHRPPVETVVDPRLADRFGPRRADSDRADEREVLLVEADGGFKPAGFTSVGLVDPLPAELREERNRLLDELGLPASATARRILLSIRSDDERERIADRLLEIPNLPRVELLLSPAR